MIDGIPQISDFEITDDTPRCPKCEGPMDRGRIVPALGSPLAYEASVSPKGDLAIVSTALACLECGYVEFYADPAKLRCVLAGVELTNSGM